MRSLRPLAAVALLVASCTLDRAGVGATHDADTEPHDVGAGDAGARDDDGDGFDSTVDCDDAEAEIHPGADERCNGVDDDCDGALSDACAWHFGVPEPVLDLHPTWAPIAQCQLSDDGLRAYLVVGTQVRVASRPATDARWQPVQPIVFEVTAPGEVLGGIAVVDAERELILSRGAGLAYDLHTARRSARGEPFVEVGAIAAFASTAALEAHPSAADPLPQVLWTAVYDGAAWSIHLAQRDALAGPWRDLGRIAIEGETGGDITPFATQDASRLFFSRATPAGTAELHVAHRATDGSYAGTVPVEPVGAAAFDLFPRVDERRDALYWGSNRPWSPSPSHAIWRARICREVACPEEIVACDEPGALRSPDRRHCYFVPRTGATWVEARDACAAAAAHLVTIHSPAETQLAVGLLAASGTGTAWTAGSAPPDTTCTESPACAFEWATREPFTWPGWRAGRPATSDSSRRCVMMTAAGLLDDVGCGELAAPICERDL